MLELRYREERDNSEIAALMAWSQDAVKVALSKARRFLHDCIARADRLGDAP
jgi:DNA-directed RNA polymerase specialized sigma24 family protein